MTRLRASNVRPAAATVLASRISASALSTKSTSSWTWVCQFMNACAVERPARKSSTSCRMLARCESKGGKNSSSENQRARSSSAAASENR